MSKEWRKNGEKRKATFLFFLFPLKAVHEGSVSCVEWVRCSVALSDITKGNLGPEVCRWGCQSATNIKGSYKNKRKENGCLINTVALCLTFCVLSNIHWSPATESNI